MEPTVGDVQEDGDKEGKIRDTIPEDCEMVENLKVKDGKSSKRLEKQFQKLSKRWSGTEYNFCAGGRKMDARLER